jgi:hypothetical protein
MLIKQDQCVVLYFILKKFGITSSNLGYFVLDDASNNDTIFQELGRLQTNGIRPKKND